MNSRLLPRGRGGVRLLEEYPRLLVGLEQLLDLPAQVRLPGAGAIQKGGTLRRVGEVQRLLEELAFGHGVPRNRCSPHLA
jgi:hypothetical protein